MEEYKYIRDVFIGDDKIIPKGTYKHYTLLYEDSPPVVLDNITFEPCRPVNKVNLKFYRNLFIYSDGRIFEGGDTLETGQQVECYHPEDPTKRKIITT
jgi:hypothetical protein